MWSKLSGTTNGILEHILECANFTTERSLIVGDAEAKVLRGSGESCGVSGRVHEIDGFIEFVRVVAISRIERNCLKTTCNNCGYCA